MSIEYIDGISFKKAIHDATALLEQHKEEVNTLNVFPVPDGDTGTNMFLTLSAANKEVQIISQNHIGNVSAALAKGSLMGARGNSGVILSQLFRGFSKTLEDHAALNAPLLVEALDHGVKTIYKAVMKPKEGTILTVSRALAEGAQKSLSKNNDVLTVLASALTQAKQILAKTPDMLPVLKEAGVVDAGGQGLVYIFEGIYLSLKGENFTSVSQTQEPLYEKVTDHISNPQDIHFQYCTEFILKGEKLNPEKIKQDFLDKGDCLLVVGTPEIVKIHIHTNHPGWILEYCTALGALDEIDINNMREQSKEFQTQKESLPYDEAAASQSIPKKPYGFISVAAGEGIKALLQNLRVDEIITGGQTMNPSTEDILQSIDSINSDEIYILPNNKNIILAAQQAKEISDQSVTLIPSTTLMEGITAILAFNENASREENESAMCNALQKVKTGEITYAVRDSNYEGKAIQKDDILGLIDNHIQYVGKNIEEITMEVLSKMVDDESEIITLIYGQDINKETAATLAENIESLYPDCEVECHNGGQPLYYYIIGVE